VFISVDKQYLRNGAVFQYTSNYTDEAAAWIKGLLPYLKTQYPQMLHVQLEKCFSEEAVARLVSCVWDLIKKCVVSAADNRINALIEDMDFDEEFEFLDTDTTKYELDILVVQKEAKLAARKSTKRATDPNDADSVSTFKQQRENSTGVLTSN
jgi:hypothetical protein